MRKYTIKIFGIRKPQNTFQHPYHVLMNED